VVKGFLHEHGVPYVLKDVARDPEALAEFRRLGFRLPPVVLVDGEAVEGFQPDRLEALLFPPDERSSTEGTGTGEGSPSGGQ
jgi:glutaredoxin